MTLYHGSNIEVREPKIITPCRALDFGGSAMTERQYSTMLALLILPPLVAELCRRTGADEADVLGRLYHSALYEKLCDERLKLWHYSPVMLADMFVEAERTGVIPYPEEA